MVVFLSESHGPCLQAAQEVLGTCSTQRKGGMGSRVLGHMIQNFSLCPGPNQPNQELVDLKAKQGKECCPADVLYFGQ